MDADHTPSDLTLMIVGAVGTVLIMGVVLIAAVVAYHIIERIL